MKEKRRRFVYVNKRKKDKKARMDFCRLEGLRAAPRRWKQQPVSTETALPVGVGLKRHFNEIMHLTIK